MEEHQLMIAMAPPSYENENNGMVNPKKTFKSSILNNDWDVALKIYEEYGGGEDFQRMKINRSEERALHLALRFPVKHKKKEDVIIVSKQRKREEVVKKLIDRLTVPLAELVDHRGNTPLHLAAEIEHEIQDHEPMCVYMAHKQPDGIGHRNVVNETPLFLAALYGNRQSFYRLSDFCHSNYGIDKIYEYGRRSNDGSTVLHCAVNEEFFDMACEIVCRFPEFVHSVDERGYSPLHLLARKPSVFKSSSQLTWLQNKIYDRIPEKMFNLTKHGQHMCNATPLSERIPKTMKFFLKPIVVILRKKEKHWWSKRIMNLLLEIVGHFNYAHTGCKPTDKSDNIFELIRISNESQDNQKMKDSQISLDSSQKNSAEPVTPIIFAAKNGITEMVDRILKEFPLAIFDTDPKGQNVMLLVLENRKLEVFKLLINRKFTKDLLHHIDNDGNNALHHAATITTYQPWFAPNAVLQMQWELKWFECIKEHLPLNMLANQNKAGLTPDQIFMSTHSVLLQNDTDWLMKTSDSCTIVAALIATVAFATSASLPGGISGENGEPVLRQEHMFEVFAISSLVALCFSLTAVLMFLSILTSRHQAMDFHVYLPRKILIGLTALFVSIASMLVSFCGGHFFVLKNIIKRAQVLEYLVAFLPVTFFIIAQCPLYLKLFSATVLKKDP